MNFKKLKNKENPIIVHSHSEKSHSSADSKSESPKNFDNGMTPQKTIFKDELNEQTN